MAKQNKPKKNSIFFKFVFFLLFISLVVFLGILKYLNVLPNKYYLLLISVLIIVLCFFGLILLNRRIKKGIKIFFTFLSIILIASFSVISYYGYSTKDVINKITKKVDYKTENYSVVILNSRDYEDINDLEGLDIGYLDNGSKGNKKAIEKIEKSIESQNDDYDDVKKLSDDLLKKQIQAVLVEDSFKSILEEESSDFESDTKVLYKFSVKIPEEKTSKQVDVTKKPFNIYLTGIDTYGKITSVSRSDVNIVATINPVSGKILLTSIPRDYYVTLAGKNAKDKLTHAGIYGVDTSVKSIEDLLDIKINYYVKVNFTSIVKIVDSLGGITVHSDYNFVSKDNYRYVKGNNILNGKKTLSFARERHAFASGDVQRGKNQMYVIEGMANELMQFSSVTKFDSLLDSLEGTFETNLSSDEISKLIKMQIDRNINWEIESTYLEGTGASMSTYSTKARSYVMVPDNTSIASAKTKISKVENE